MTSKKCCKCKEYKELSEFNKNKTKADGLSTYCKICLKNYMVSYRVNNRKKLNRAANDYYYRKVLKIREQEKLEYYKKLGLR